MARARCSALLTDAVVVSSSEATSSAFQRSTSRRISTARWRGGRCCSAATNASRTDSRATAISAGSPASGSTRSSTIGSSQVSSPRVRTSDASTGSHAVADRSIGRARRPRVSIVVRQTFVAIRYSHDRTPERPSNPSTDFQARTIVSWTASSASKAEPSIR